MGEKILVAVDGSENSLEALSEAVELAKLIHNKIVVVNVQPSFRTLHSRLFINEETIKEYQKELFDNATKSATEYLQKNEADFELKLLIGDPVQQISQLADKLSVKYIILGSRGMGVVKGTVLGSVSNGILHQTKIPLLIIPQKG